MVEGPWVARVNGLERVPVDIVRMRTPDGHGRLELRSVMFTVESVDDTVARGAIAGSISTSFGSETSSAPARQRRRTRRRSGGVRGQVQTLLHARPCGHHRRAGRGTSEAVIACGETGGALLVTRASLTPRRPAKCRHPAPSSSRSARWRPSTRPNLTIEWRDTI
jgi:hypothetical protein